MRRSVRVVLAILLITVLLIMSGCKGGSTNFKFGKSPEENTAVAEKRVYTGTKGLTMTMLKNLPPDEIYDSNNIQIVAEIKNEGTHTVQAPRFYLAGYDSARVRIDNPVYDTITSIDGKSEFLLDGGYETIRFESTDITLPRGTDTLPVRFLIYTCYDYETIANPVVCIDPNKQNPALAERGACEVRDVSMSGGQGAPVEVTRAGVDSTIDKAFFRIEINNAGGGQVTDIYGSRGDCPFGLQYDDLDEVRYKVTLSGLNPIKCSPLVDGMQKVKLADGKATITCQFDISPEHKSAYTTPLQIELNYGYTESIYKDVKIISVGR